MIRVGNPLPLFLDARGNLSDGGFIYIGQAGSDPEANPIIVYWDVGFTQVAQQPLRTVGGYIVNGVTPANVFANATDYSQRVRDADASQVTYSSSTFNDSQSYQPIDADLTAIAQLATTAYGRNLLTLANQAALVAATGIPTPLPAAGGTVTGDITRQGAGTYVYAVSGTGCKIYPPLATGATNPATGAGSLQGFY